MILILKMKYILISLLFLQAYSYSLNEDLDVYYKNYIKQFGYELEENPVITEDGYILSLWHLQPQKPNGKVVFLQHGLADTAWTFFQIGQKSLPFFLLKEGYDVWLGNIRGSIFSSKHVTKTPQSGLYDFTIDDFVKYDLPSMVNFIKSKTGVAKLSYIAHSQGSTMFFMLSMHDPTFVQNNFDHFATVGTVPNIAYTHFSPIELLDKIAGILKAVKIFDTFNLSNTQRNLVAGFCKLSPGICGKLFDSAAALHPSKRMNYTDIYNFMYYYPGGVSKTNLLHWSQIHKMKKLVYYNPDFEKEQTAEPYNTENLKKWKIKSLIARTDDDTFSSYEDVTEFYMAVEDKSYIQLLDLTNYSHMDVLAAESAYEDVFIPIINFLKY